MSLVLIEKQLKKYGYKTDGDVSELYLGRQGLKEVMDLSRFRMLKCLWLNHNKIPKITCLTNICRLSELYLNNNELCDITGSLKHLTSLRTLMLHDNHLAKLQATMKELKDMTGLHTLSLFHNPLAQEPCYRLHIIHHIPSVQLLDRESVAHKERETAFKLFNPERTAVMQSIGFGRRTDSVLSSRRPLAQSSAVNSAKTAQGNNTAEDKNREINCVEAMVLRRAQHKTLMQFSILDWSAIPYARQKREESYTVQSPQLKTIKLW
uniref:Leucine rich repeat containing 72 n=1 Tax=Leptobrachium leishanense TaxID=445787 RepID=A0A8C5PP04_9ANUR